ncbi:ferric reductase-like protein transmembrane component 4 [Setomelanomma holmii]|uniref:Ferric reductase-like protein transmembrane component 4 n=1 Tax=Setomelanomma holmii TaxID=210430 RepID=A0A9P4GYM3_9PLEO|nr:ferric reductase-like protein transmembrane component 4 [Setomelanomma holmii]
MHEYSVHQRHRPRFRTSALHHVANSRMVVDNSFESPRYGDGLCKALSGMWRLGFTCDLMPQLQNFASLAILAPGVSAIDRGNARRRGNGLVGYGIDAANPACAFGCREAISGATLNCSTVEEMPGMEGMDMGDALTLANCISTRCTDVLSWKHEKYWKDNVAGAFVVQPDPKETFQEALAKVNGTPTTVYNETGVLNVTSIVAEEFWWAAYNTDVIFWGKSVSKLVLLLSGVVIPISFSLLRFVPFPGGLRSKFNALFIDPPLFGSRNRAMSKFGFDHAMTRGQGLFIGYLMVINVVLSAVKYEYANPNTWYPHDKWRCMVMLVSNRLGLLSFANLPLIFLYAGRNKFTWVAAISTIQAILHSLIYLQAYVKAGTHASESVKPYWYWAIVGTLGMSILFPTSIGLIRLKAYEIFLAWHIVISILVIVGCYWHIVFGFQHAWGYELWVIITMAVWAFDRIARWMRLLRNGVKTAEVTAIDDEYFSVTIPGVTVSGYAYLYFPTLTWRFWENHSFSVASTILSPPADSTRRNTPTTSSDIEKHPDVHVGGRNDSESSPVVPFKQTVKAGVTFYVRDKTGTTAALRNRISLPVLVEGGYSSHSASSLDASPILIALVGGVGITAVLPHLRGHPGRVKLYWGCRTQALVDDVKRTGAVSSVEHETFVGSRMNVYDILASEINIAGTSEVAVLVSAKETASPVRQW